MQHESVGHPATTKSNLDGRQTTGPKVLARPMMT